MYTLFSFTAVVAFGDGNIFAKISWQTFDRYFDCKVISLLVTAIGVVCCRKLFYSKESRQESAFTSNKVVLMFIVTATGVVCCRKLFYSKESRQESAFTSNKVVLMFIVTATGVVCCRKLFYSKESRQESAITSSVKLFRCLFVTVAGRFSHGRNVYKLLPKEAK